MSTVTITEELLHFSKAVVRKYCNRIGLKTTEDLESLGFIGLVRASTSYIPSKSSFKTWAALKIRGELTSYVRDQVGSKKGKAKKEAKRVLLIPCKAKGSIEKETSNKDFVDKLLKRLPKKQQEILILYYKYGYSFEEIGQFKHYSRANAGIIHCDALNRLRQSILFKNNQ